MKEGGGREGGRKTEIRERKRKRAREILAADAKETGTERVMFVCLGGDGQGVVGKRNTNRMKSSVGDQELSGWLRSFCNLIFRC